MSGYRGGGPRFGGPPRHIMRGGGGGPPRGGRGGGPPRGGSRGGFQNNSMGGGRRPTNMMDGSGGPSSNSGPPTNSGPPSNAGPRGPPNHTGPRGAPRNDGARGSPRGGFQTNNNSSFRGRGNFRGNNRSFDSSPSSSHIKPISSQAGKPAPSKEEPKELKQVKVEVKKEVPTPAPVAPALTTPATPVVAPVLPTATPDKPDESADKPTTETPAPETPMEQETVPHLTEVYVSEYLCDLYLDVDKDGVTGKPRSTDGFDCLWASLRATHGVSGGKVAFEVLPLEKTSTSTELNACVIRVGWSHDDFDISLGENSTSWGYGGTAKKSHDNSYVSYGETFGVGDSVICYVDFESQPKTISFTKNGKFFGTAFPLKAADLKKPLFPSISTKNIKFLLNFGQQPTRSPLEDGYKMIAFTPAKDIHPCIAGPATCADAEFLLMVGLPAAGKSTWCESHAAANPDKRYNILGTNLIMEKMKVTGLTRKRNYHGRWEELIKKATGILNTLFKIVEQKVERFPRNIILDQTNVYESARRRKIRSFNKFGRKVAVCIVNKNEELNKRNTKREKDEGKFVPESAVMEMKANFKIPTLSEGVNEIQFIEMDEAAAKKQIDEFASEGKRFKTGGSSSEKPKTAEKRMPEKPPFEDKLAKRSKPDTEPSRSDSGRPASSSQDRSRDSNRSNDRSRGGSRGGSDSRGGRGDRGRGDRGRGAPNDRRKEDDRRDSDRRDDRSRRSDDRGGRGGFSGEKRNDVIRSRDSSRDGDRGRSGDKATERGDRPAVRGDRPSGKEESGRGRVSRFDRPAADTKAGSTGRDGVPSSRDSGGYGGRDSSGGRGGASSRGGAPSTRDSGGFNRDSPSASRGGGDFSRGRGDFRGGRGGGDRTSDSFNRDGGDSTRGGGSYRGRGSGPPSRDSGPGNRDAGYGSRDSGDVKRESGGFSRGGSGAGDSRGGGARQFAPGWDEKPQHDSYQAPTPATGLQQGSTPVNPNQSSWNQPQSGVNQYSAPRPSGPISSQAKPEPMDRSSEGYGGSQYSSGGRSYPAKPESRDHQDISQGIGHNKSFGSTSTEYNVPETKQYGLPQDLNSSYTLPRDQSGSSGGQNTQGSRGGYNQASQGGYGSEGPASQSGYGRGGHTSQGGYGSNAQTSESGYGTGGQGGYGSESQSGYGTGAQSSQGGYGSESQPPAAGYNAAPKSGYNPSSQAPQSGYSAGSQAPQSGSGNRSSVGGYDAGGQAAQGDYSSQSGYSQSQRSSYGAPAATGDVAKSGYSAPQSTGYPSDKKSSYGTPGSQAGASYPGQGGSQTGASYAGGYDYGQSTASYPQQGGMYGKTEPSKSADSYSKPDYSSASYGQQQSSHQGSQHAGYGAGYGEAKKYGDMDISQDADYKEPAAQQYGKASSDLKESVSQIFQNYGSQLSAVGGRPVSQEKAAPSVQSYTQQYETQQYAPVQKYPAATPPAATPRADAQQPGYQQYPSQQQFSSSAPQLPYQSYPGYQ